MSLIQSSFAYAKDPSHQLHTHIHIHGLVEVDLAIVGGAGLMEIHAPAQSIVGFEGVPATTQQEEAVGMAQMLFSDILSVATFDDETVCAAEADKAELIIRGEHAEFFVRFAFECNTSPAKADFSNFVLNFPDVERLVLASIVEDGVFVQELSPFEAVIDYQR